MKEFVFPDPNNPSKRKAVFLSDDGSVLIGRQYQSEGEWVYDQSCGAILTPSEVRTIFADREREALLEQLAIAEKRAAETEKARQREWVACEEFRDQLDIVRARLERVRAVHCETCIDRNCNRLSLASVAELDAVGTGKVTP